MRSLLLICVVATAYAGTCRRKGGMDEVRQMFLDGGMNDEIRQRFLDVHNELRSLVANGEAKDGKGGNAPPAAAMYRLRYDYDVEKYAVEHAAKCVFEHSSNDDFGENIYMDSLLGDKVKAAEQASRNWFAELAKHGVGKKLVYKNMHGVGHYTQMVWASTKAIGCAINNCPHMTFAVCNYKEAGNYIGEEIYETGPPCSKCTGACFEGLCV